MTTNRCEVMKSVDALHTSKHSELATTERHQWACVARFMEPGGILHTDGRGNIFCSGQDWFIEGADRIVHVVMC